MTQKSITDTDIQALIDREVSPSEAEFIWAAINHTPSFRQRYEQLHKQKCMLQQWASYRNSLNE